MPETERRVWQLLTRDFRWQLPDEIGVTLPGVFDPGARPARLQIFEVAVAAIFAKLRPDYTWYVTPNTPDEGVDFIGRHGFLQDDTHSASQRQSRSTDSARSARAWMTLFMSSAAASREWQRASTPRSSSSRSRPG
jgi:hypothetical protein